MLLNQMNDTPLLYVFYLLLFYRITSINQTIDQSFSPLDAILLTMSRYQKKKSAMVQAASLAYSPVMDFSLSLQDDALARRISGKYPLIPSAMEPKALIAKMVCMHGTSLSMLYRFIIAS
jgi:hypothetical protein